MISTGEGGEDASIGAAFDIDIPVIAFVLADGVGVEAAVESRLGYSTRRAERSGDEVG